MATRVLLILAGVVVFFGLAWIVASLLLVRSVENGVSRHVIDGSGITRGGVILVVAIVLGLIAWAVRTG
jgi:hypothetical protein